MIHYTFLVNRCHAVKFIGFRISSIRLQYIAQHKIIYTAMEKKDHTHIYIYI